MIRCEVATKRFELDDKLRTYIDDKIGSLDKYMPRKMRQAASASVMLEDDAGGREDNRHVCEVVLTICGTTMVSREGTVNMYAAIDIVEAKLKSQIAKFKEKVTLEPRRTRMINRLVGRVDEGETEQTLAP